MSEIDNDLESSEAVQSGTTERSRPTPAATYGATPPSGELLTLDKPEAAKLAHRLFRAQDHLYDRRNVERRLNRRRRNGETSIWITKDENKASFDIWSPPGASKYPIPVYNKGDRLCARVTSQLYADDPKPDVEPSRDDDEAKDAAQLAQRVLEDVDSEGNLNDGELQRMATDKAHTSGSGYVFYYVDPYAGGRHPMQVEAGVEAQHFDQATKDASGQAYPELVPKFLQPDGALSPMEDETGKALPPVGAALEWQPRLDATVYGAEHVRFIPWDSSDIWDADGAMVAEYRPWGQLVRLYPALAKMPEDRAKALCATRPKGWRELLPNRDGKPWDPPITDDTPLADRLCAHLRVILTECGEYPDGCNLAVVGEDECVLQETWVGEDESGRFKLDIPMTQQKLWRKDGDPHGAASFDILGNSTESRAGVLGMYFDYMDELRNRKVFIPDSSTLSGREWVLETLKYIPISGGAPEYQEIPPLPKEVGELFQNISAEMDDAMLLQQEGQGLNDPNNESGRAKLAVIGQVHANMSDARQYMHRGHIRAWRIKLQLMRHRYTKQQMLQYTGDDGAYQIERWQGSDLAGVKDVKIRPGTGTMMPPLQKIEQAIAFRDAGVLQATDVLETASRQVSAITGLQDNVHLHRIKRQLAAWEKGGTEAAKNPIQAPIPSVAGVDALGQPIVAPPQPDPAALAIFMPLPCDLEPMVAAMRAREIGRVMASTKYETMPQGWQLALIQAYLTAVSPGGITGAPGPGGAPPPPPDVPQQPPQLSPAEQQLAGGMAA